MITKLHIENFKTFETLDFVLNDELKIIVGKNESGKSTILEALDRYFFSENGHVYRDRVSEFICLLDDRTNGKVVRRLATIFNILLVDELQDLNGYDLELIERILRSGIEVIGVCDPRQCTFVTNRSAKNRGVSRAKIVEWIERLQKAGLFVIEERTKSWRSNQAICDFADLL